MSAQPPNTAEAEARGRRARVVKDLIVFQVKLVLEGIKDLVLGPLSVAAAVLDLLTGKDAPDRYLDGLMRLGQRYEDWLGLYRISAKSERGELGEAGELAAPIEVVQVVQVSASPQRHAPPPP